MRWNIEEVRDLKEALVCDKDRKPLSYTCCIELIETIEGLYDDVDSLMKQLNRNIFAIVNAETKIKALQAENERLADETIKLMKENAKNSNKKDELVKVLKQAREALYAARVDVLTKETDELARDAVEAIDALIGGKEDA